MQSQAGKNEETGNHRQPIAFGDKYRKHRQELKSDCCNGPPRTGPPSPRCDRSRQAKHRHEPEVKTGKENVVPAQISDDAEVVVLEGVPEISNLAREKPKPDAGIGRNILPRPGRPV